MAGRPHLRYGAGPWHLAAVLGALALAGYAVFLVSDAPALPRIALWFAGAVVLHDLLLFPLYTVADRALGRVSASVSLRNHLRVPVLASGLLLLLFLPGIAEHGSGTYLAATGQTQEPFAERWLLLTAGFFAASGLVFAVRVLKRRARARRSGGPARSRPRPGRGAARGGSG
ncbi:hypothetical protein B0I33_10991 [Prauserella shujinwangii]|uniref:Uncharacterized protein n=1 Tax=Prauserella shujinwangii TaxID=1453103 RepID=A0A2T0LQ02_9PSEU|nr:hypothetical protein [Prauserella shujinwangii]PRX45428.1 hypothetical protein B0I33_10991 [Prauserella shujinwangii]